MGLASVSLSFGERVWLFIGVFLGCRDGRLNLSLVDEEDNGNNQLAANSQSATLTSAAALSGITLFPSINSLRAFSRYFSSPHPSNSLKNDDTPRLQRPEPRAPCSQEPGLMRWIVTSAVRQPQSLLL